MKKYNLVLLPRNKPFGSWKMFHWENTIAIEKNMNLYRPNKSIVSVKTFDEGVDIVYRERSDSILLCNSPDRIYREEWRIIGGTLQLDKTVEAKHTPSHYVEESIEF